MFCALFKAGLDKYQFSDSVPDKNNIGLGKNSRNTLLLQSVTWPKYTSAEFVQKKYCSCKDLFGAEHKLLNNNVFCLIFKVVAVKS